MSLLGSAWPEAVLSLGHNASLGVVEIRIATWPSQRNCITQTDRFSMLRLGIKQVGSIRSDGVRVMSVTQRVMG